jgi:hypothetical protein
VHLSGYFVRHQATALIEKVRFAFDSPLEQAGFELRVALAPVSL